MHRAAQVKLLEGENGRQKQELRQLQARVSQEERKEEEARREAFALKQRVLECEAGRDAALNKVADGVQEFGLHLDRKHETLNRMLRFIRNPRTTVSLKRLSYCCYQKF